MILKAIYNRFEPRNFFDLGVKNRATGDFDYEQFWKKITYNLYDIRRPHDMLKLEALTSLDLSDIDALWTWSTNVPPPISK